MKAFLPSQFRLLFFLLIIISATSCRREFANAQKDRVVHLSQNWEYVWESNTNTVKEIPYNVVYNQPLEWHQYDLENPPEKTNTSQILWLRIKIPDTVFVNTAVFINEFSYYQAFELYTGNSLIYKNSRFYPAFTNRYLNYNWHVISIPHTLLNDYIYLRFYSENSEHIGLTRPIYFGSEKRIMSELVTTRLDLMIVGSIFIILGFFTFTLLFRNKNNRLLFTFGGMTLVLGLYFFFESNILWFAFQNQIVKAILLDFFTYISPVFIFAFLGEMLPKPMKSFFLNFWKIQLFAALLAFAFTLSQSNYYNFAHQLSFAVMLLGSFLFIFIGLREIIHGNIEARIIGVGAMFFIVSSIHLVLINFKLVTYNYQNYFHFGLLAFILSLCFTLVRRFDKTHHSLENHTKALEIKSKQLRDSYYQLERNNVDLENKVSERTKVLNETNQTLIELNKALLESEISAHQLVDAVLEGVCIHKSGQIFEMNAQFASMLGYQIADLIGVSINDFVPSRNHQEFFADNETNTLREIAMTRNDGENLIMEVIQKPIVFKGLNVFVAAVRNITERVKINEELKQYEFIANATKESMTLVSRDYRYEAVNDAFCIAHSRHRNEIIGKKVIEFYGEKRFNESIKFSIDQCFAGETVHDPGWFSFGDLGKRYISVTYYPYFRNKIEVSHVAVFSYDLTEGKVVEEALRKSEARFRAIFANASVGFGIISPKERYIQINITWAEMLGYTVNELVKTSYFDIFHPEDRDLARINFRRLLRKEIYSDRVTRRLIRKDNKTIWVSLSPSILLSENNEVEALIVIIVDITNRVLAEEALEKAKFSAETANRSKSEFLANMSHEIRTPMNSVLGFTDLLSTMVTDDKQLTYLQAIKSSGKNLLTIINDILDLSKIEAGKLEIKYEIIDIIAIINEIKQIFSLRTEEKKLDFIVALYDTIPQHFMLDEIRLRQILFNIIGNAVKFTESGYIKLTVSAESLKTIKTPEKPMKLVDIIFTIEDTGIGIPKEYHTLVFEAFRQQEGQDTKRYGGTGLGLAITKRLAEKLGGTISLQSTVGKGSTFMVAFRNIEISEFSSPISSENEYDNVQITFDAANLLIVDDVPDNRALLREFFRKTLIKVTEASNGFEAIELAKKLMPNAILMDIRMPKMDGYETTSRIRQIEGLENVPVIAVTASVLKQDKERIEAAGFSDFIRKPAQMNELYFKLAHHLKHTKTIKTLTNNIVVPVNKFVINPEIGEQLENQFLQQWETISKKNSFDEIENFAHELKLFSEQHSLYDIMQYSAELLNAVENFDIDKIETGIKIFPNFLRR